MGPPGQFFGDDILLQLEEVPICTPSKAPNNDDTKCKCGVDELN